MILLLLLLVVAGVGVGLPRVVAVQLQLGSLRLGHLLHQHLAEGAPQLAPRHAGAPATNSLKKQFSGDLKFIVIYLH